MGHDGSRLFFLQDAQRAAAGEGAKARVGREGRRGTRSGSSRPSSRRRGFAGFGPGQAMPFGRSADRRSAAGVPGRPLARPSPRRVRAWRAGGACRVCRPGRRLRTAACQSSSIVGRRTSCSRSAPLAFHRRLRLPPTADRPLAPVSSPPAPASLFLSRGAAGRQDSAVRRVDNASPPFILSALPRCRYALMGDSH